MIDFLSITIRQIKGGVEILPKFKIRKSKDLMLRGGDFYAIWLEDLNTWSTDEQHAIDLIDWELRKAEEEYKANNPGTLPTVKYMWDADSGSIDRWHKYCQKQMRDNYHMLDEILIFSNTETTRESYSSKKLSYPLESGDISAWDEILSVLYSEEERHKIEWAIGSIVSGDSKTLQKFMVLYGAAGTGKSTVLNIIQKLFEGYYSVFDAKSLGSSSGQFALEAFRKNPLVAIQHDGDLSKIEDNTRLNSLVSHEEMIVNEKYTKGYSNRFKAFLFMGTNRPVKITDGKSGLLRRLIDVTPTGKTIPNKKYRELMKKVDFELGHIAQHCLEVYSEDPGYYNNYVPITMMGASNDFYNFVESKYRQFAQDDGVGLKTAWAMYTEYCDYAKIPYSNSQRIFREELRNYFWSFEPNYIDENGNRCSGWYSGFKKEIFEVHKPKKKEIHKPKLIEFVDAAESIFDKEYADCFAQYASVEGTPRKNWDKVKTKLSSIDTSKLHYVRVPENHIVIDFDIPDENGNKCFEKNLEEASKWPETYAELSKSGGGIHLHYIYTGDVSKLSRVYGDHIEIKIFTGKSSLRRKLTKCNNLPIANISSGLPLKGDKKMVNFDAIQSEKGLREMIKRNLNKEFHGATKPSVDFIYKILEDAYDSGLRYDVTDMRNSVLGFAANSTNQSLACIKLVNNMKFKSDEIGDFVEAEKDIVVFYDVEVFPNLFLVNWMYDDDDAEVVRMINPRPAEIEQLLKYKLIGFNNRSYDNHMLYACMMGYSNEELYRLSGRLVSKDKDVSRKAKFGEAFNLSYTDVYDFAAKKQSLKKWEIELGIHHQELGLPWDQPVPEEKWNMVAEYCDNDVKATRAVFHHCKGDFTARQILAELADMSVNDTTNSLTTKIIFGNNKKPQSEFNYRDMSEVSYEDYIPEGFDNYTRFNKQGQPIFPGYEYDQYKNKSIYREEDPSEGGYVYAEQGIFGNVALLDVASLHPSSVINEELFGSYTQRFADIKQARIYIKHGEFDKARHMLDGRLAPYLNDESAAKDLAQALKIAINSVYGLTSAKFTNAFKDPHNVDNIVAKRGALFMINLKHEVQKRGFTVVHIKTDSIKIADATLEIAQFVTDYGKMYGYDFEHEACYEKMCLVNNAVYIAKYATLDHCYELYGGEYVEKNRDTLAECKKHGGEWTATGTQFAVPYVFKKLFSKEDIVFDDLCETKSSKVGAIYLDMNEAYEQQITDDEAELKQIRRELNKTLRKEPDNKLKIAEIENVIDSLSQQIEEAHDYMFIGRVGQFCPVKPGANGGEMFYKNDAGKYLSISGTKGYRWLESEVVRTLGKDIIDLSYYDSLVNDAADTISFYGDLEWFCSDEPYVGPPYDKQGRPIYLDFGRDGQ